MKNDSFLTSEIRERLDLFSSLIIFFKVSFTVDLAFSSKSCLSHTAESNLNNQSMLSLLFLVYPNRGYSKFLNYKDVRLKIRPVSVLKTSLNFRLIHDSAGELSCRDFLSRLSF